MLANSGIYSKALQAAQIYSVRKFLRTSGIGGGFPSTFPITRWLTCPSESPYLIWIRRVNMAATISLCRSKSPLLVLLNEVMVIASMRASTLLPRDLGDNGSSIRSS